MRHGEWKKSKFHFPQREFLIDMNLSPLWVKFLAEAGLESVHWSAVGAPSAPDSEIMEYAASNGFVIFTHDLDFGALLAGRKSPRPSVIQIRAQDILPSSIGHVVAQAIQVSRDQLNAGALVTIEPNRSRIRLLPL